NNTQPGFLDHGAKGIDRRDVIVFLQDDNAARLEKRRNSLEEIPVNAPVRIVRPKIAEVLVNEVRRVGNNEIPLLGGRYAPQIVGTVDRNAIRQGVVRDGAAAGLNRFGVYVGKAQCLAQTVRQQRKSDKAWPGAPLKRPPLHWK